MFLNQSIFSIPNELIACVTRCGRPKRSTVPPVNLSPLFAIEKLDESFCSEGTWAFESTSVRETVDFDTRLTELEYGGRSGRLISFSGRGFLAHCDIPTRPSGAFVKRGGWDALGKNEPHQSLFDLPWDWFPADAWLFTAPGDTTFAYNSATYSPIPLEAVRPDTYFSGHRQY